MEFLDLRLCAFIILIDRARSKHWSTSTPDKSVMKGSTPWLLSSLNTEYHQLTSSPNLVGEKHFNRILILVHFIMSKVEHLFKKIFFRSFDFCKCYVLAMIFNWVIWRFFLIDLPVDFGTFLACVLKYFYILFIICLLLFIYWHNESVKFYAVNWFVCSFGDGRICCWFPILGFCVAGTGGNGVARGLPGRPASRGQ